MMFILIQVFACVFNVSGKLICKLMNGYLANVNLLFRQIHSYNVNFALRFNRVQIRLNKITTSDVSQV